MERLSSPLDQIRPRYDVVVIGSGYGGAVCASRLARAGRSVCVLERGREVRPGEYPSTATAFAAQVQAALPRGQVGPKTGLYRFHIDDDIGVIAGCGLGGTSLINAGVVKRPDPSVMEDPSWPAELRADADGLLREGFERAEAMLRPAAYPERTADGRATPRLPKLEALEAASRAIGGSFSRARVTVSFEAGTSPGGVRQPACKLCGDCFSGCNHGAKNSLLTNYLPDARRHGAEIFTSVDVRHVERGGEGWVVVYDALDAGREGFDGAPSFVAADVVVLAAGTLGSSEILLRSRDAGLALSTHLGKRFSANGCTMGFGYDLDREVRSVGWGDRAAAAPVGPAISGSIELRDPLDPKRRLTIQDTSIPGAVGALMAHVLAAAAPAREDRGAVARLGAAAREFAGRVGGPGLGPMRSTQTYAVTAGDDAGGVATLEGDRLRLRWPGVGVAPSVGAVHERLGEATRALGGTYIPNPAWRDLPRHPPMTPHPLGGCSMADAAERGVVDHKGRVFQGAEGAAVHEGLYVCDGAIMPGALGCNPLLTITALAERCVELLARDRGWRIELGEAPRRTPIQLRARRSTGFGFTERMEGELETESGTSPFGFVLSVRWDDIEALLRDPAIEARTGGTVVAPALHPEPLAVTDGRFRLFVPGPALSSGRETFRMLHRAVLRDRGGRTYTLEGHKEIRDDPGPDLWLDTTTLAFTLTDGADGLGPVAARGVVRVRLADLLRQIGTLSAGGAPGRGADLRGRARFVGMFLGKLRSAYGGLVLPLVS